jgi:hypothetical protein
MANWTGGSPTLVGDDVQIIFRIYNTIVGKILFDLTADKLKCLNQVKICSHGQEYELPDL